MGGGISKNLPKPAGFNALAGVAFADAWSALCLSFSNNPRGAAGKDLQAFSLFAGPRFSAMSAPRELGDLHATRQAFACFAGQLSLS